MTTSRLAALAITLLLPAVALADRAPPPAPPAPPPTTKPTAPAAIRPPSFELLDRGDAVEIIAHNVKAARTAIIPMRSRLQVPLTGAPSAKRVVPTDPTVELIELGTENTTRMLSVKLGFDRAEVKALARFAQAIQVGEDLHILVPRKLPADGVAPRLPDPTLPPELAAAVSRIDSQLAQILGPKLEPTRKLAVADGEPAAPIAAPQAAPIAVPIAAPPAPPIDAPRKPTSPPDAKLAVSPDARADATLDATAGTQRSAGELAPDAGKTAKPLSHALASDADDGWSKISMFAVLGIAAAGAGIWLMRRRRTNLAAPATIEVIAQRSLGGKTRIVWLSVGPREMIVSVTPQQVRMLGQWRKTDAAAALPGAYTRTDAHLPTRAELTDEPNATGIPQAIDRPLSPAVTGILRLRGRTAQVGAVGDEIASGDVVADELWAREIVAATGARR